MTRDMIRQRTRGLTLVEMISVLAITALMMGAVFSALTVSIRATVRTREVVRATRILSGVARVIRADIEGAFALKDGTLAPLVGKPLDAPGDVTVLAVTTTALLQPDALPGGLARVEYVMRPLEDGNGTYELLRREMSYRPGKPIDSAESVAERLTTNISAWRLQYFDGAEWVSEWERGALPQSVRLDIAWGPLAEASDRMQSVIFSPVANVDAEVWPTLN